MKRTLLTFILSLCLLGIISVPTLASAQSANNAEGVGFTNPLKVNSIDELITTLLKVAGRLGAIISVLFFIYAGFLYVTAQGDEDTITKAHETLKWTAIGTAVLIGASALAKIIQSTVNSIN